MSRAWAGGALRLLADGKCAAMVTIAGVSGSAPREAGTRMIVSPDEVIGTIGGGNLEHIAIGQARRLLRQDAVDVVQQDYPLGILLAQCCGGRVRLLVERLDARCVGWMQVVETAERAGARYTLEGRIAEGRIARSARPGWDAGSEGAELFTASGGPASAKAPWSRIVERVAPMASELWLFGAGHVGKAVAHIAGALPFRLNWIDTREDLAGAGPVIRPDAVQAVGEARAGAFFLVMTHSHDLDFDLVQAILARGDAGFCGLIGSATKRARFASRLEKAGVSPTGMTCPIGIGAIRSKDPACIAVAVAADLLVRLEAGAQVQGGGMSLAALHSG